MKKTVLLLAFSASFYLSAQRLSSISTTNALENIVNDDVSIFNESRSKKASNKQFVGTPYLFEEFKPGTLYFKGQKKGSYMLRYNVYEEAFETQNTSSNNNSYNQVTENSDIEVEMDGKRYLYKYYTVDNVQQFGYFEVVNELKKVKLLKKNRKLIQEAKTAVTSFDVTRPSRLVNKEGFFILIGDKKVVEVKQSNKQIAKTFEEFNINIKNFLKENKLNVKNSDDLAQVLTYIDENLQAE